MGSTTTVWRSESVGSTSSGTTAATSLPCTPQRSGSGASANWLRGPTPWPTRMRRARSPNAAGASRSEEHTSELQSLAYLVCRLLLEKKKKTRETSTKQQKQEYPQEHNIHYHNAHKNNKVLKADIYVPRVLSRWYASSAIANANTHQH